jgi:acid phosphatase
MSFRVLVGGPFFALTAAGLLGCSGSTKVHVSPPSIAAEPANQTVKIGQTTSFTVAATGTAPLSYQWQKNGAALSGATSPSYTTSPTMSSDNGAQFTVVVSNSAGSVTSNAARLTVSAAAPSVTTGRFGHVGIVVEENANYSAVTSSSMPYLFGLMSQYGLATQYYANTHPSIGNYFMLTTGQILTNDDRQTPSSFPVSVDNVVREIVAAGKTWKAYAESLPSVGYLGGDTTSGGGHYYVRHVPLAYLTDVQNSSAQRQNLVPSAQLAQDLSTGNLPNYSFITPNGCDDAHDCSLGTADNWLRNQIDPLIKNSVFQKDGLLIIVFDESSNDNTNGGGRVVCALISPAFSKLGYQSTTLYQHESVLRLTLEGLGVTTLPGAASRAPDMGEFDSPTPAISY